MGRQTAPGTMRHDIRDRCALTIDQHGLARGLDGVQQRRELGLCFINGDDLYEVCLLLLA